MELKRMFMNGTAGNSTDKYRRIIENFFALQLTITEPLTIVLLVLYIPVFLLALSGNSLIISVIIKFKKMRRVKNFFLVNLAVADLCITLLCMPLSVATAVDKRWYYGEFLCKSSSLLQGNFFLYF